MSYVSECSIPATHPGLDGHFPDNPVVPGVILLEQVPPGSLTAVIQSFKGKPLRAKVVITPGKIDPITADKEGTFVIDLKPGNYEVTISHPGYVGQTRPVKIING